MIWWLIQLMFAGACLAFVVWSLPRHLKDIREVRAEKRAELREAQERYADAKARHEEWKVKQ